MLFPNHILDDIRMRLSISDVISKKVIWDKRKSRPSKGDFWACCPFHQEKTPSFRVDDQRGRYHCFGCGASGDHFKFIMETEGLNFPEAVERLAGEAGVNLPKPDAKTLKEHKIQKGLIEALKEANLYFKKHLRSEAGKAALSYALKRGLNENLINEFELGYAPSLRDGLKAHLLQKEFDEKTLIDAGLIIKPDNGRASYDRFRDRLIVPIHNLKGHVIAFGGRVMQPDQEPKYLNSPETALFKKRMILFNHHRAREPIFKSNQMIVVEGYMDAIALWKHGFHNCIASLGTAFSEEQMTLLWRFCPSPIICFDGDKAGQKAAHRLMEIAVPMLKPGYTLQLCFLPEGKDPDDIVNEGGAKAFKALIQNYTPLSEALIAKEMDVLDLNQPEKRAQLSDNLTKIAETIQHEDVRYYYKGYFRKVISKYFWSRDRQDQSKAVQKDIFYKPHPHTIERDLLLLSLYYPSLYEQSCEAIINLRGKSDSYQLIWQRLHFLIIAEKIKEKDQLLSLMPSDLKPALEEIYGLIEDDEGDKENRQEIKKKTGGIFTHLPFLKNKNIPMTFIQKYYALLLLKLQLKQSEVERDRLMKRSNISENEEKDIMSLIQDIALMKSNVQRNEEEIQSQWQSFKPSP